MINSTFHGLGIIQQATRWTEKNIVLVMYRYRGLSKIVVPQMTIEDKQNSTAGLSNGPLGGDHYFG